MERKLQRNTLDKKIAGVCSGLAEYFDIDVTLVRVAFIVAVLAGFSGILAYIILWIIVPAKPFMHGSYSGRNDRTDYRVYEENAQNSSR
jgi:phage shock protein C